MFAFGGVGEKSQCHVVPLASIVLRYWVAPFGSEQDSVGICMWILWLLTQLPVACLIALPLEV